MFVYFQYPTVSLKISKEYGTRRTTDDDSNEEGNGTDISADRGISNTTATNLSGRGRTGNATSTLLGNRGIFCHREIDIYIDKKYACYRPNNFAY